MSRSSTLLNSTTASPLSLEAEQKKKFLLFIKILIKTLDQSADPDIRETAKFIISDCTRRNRQGDPKYSPLMDAIDSRLRGHVGEVIWRRAHTFLQHYMRKEERARMRQLVVPQNVAAV